MSRNARSPVDVCLVVPPFDATKFPLLGVAVLAAATKARGLSVATIHGGVDLAARLGVETNDAICRSWDDHMTGERLFHRHAYPRSAWKQLGPLEPLPEKRQRTFDQAAPHIGPFLRSLVRQVLARKPRIVGITSMFQQNMAAVSVARAIKRRAPETCVVLGGANCAGPMGAALLKVFPWIDHIFNGEADVAFPDFCERFLRHGDRTTPQLVESAPVTHMDRVHAPDYTDYMATLRAHQRRGRLPADMIYFLGLEASRGCWWGQKSHCTFCGLNGEGMGFRSKTPERVLKEIRALGDAWGRHTIHFADNIMPVNFLREVLPVLAAWPERPRLFFEVKANLRDDQLAVMASGGVYRIQPGIESLSSHVLKLMRKGVTGMQNLVLLRNCRSRGLEAIWNILVGFPGEEVEDYAAMLALLPKIVHLQAPANLSRIVIDRFSPYHFDHAGFGIPNIEPQRGYAGLYPEDAPLMDIAYHFKGRYTTPMLRNQPLLRAFRDAVAMWKLRWEAMPKAPVLAVVEARRDGVLIEDTRGKSTTHLIAPRADQALAFFEQPRPVTGNPSEYQEEVGDLRAKDLLVEHEGALLSVVTRARASGIESPPREVTSVQRDDRAGANLVAIPA